MTKYIIKWIKRITQVNKFICSFFVVTAVTSVCLGLQAATTLRAGDVHQCYILVQGVHHSPWHGHQVQSGLQPLLVLQRSHRQGVPRTQPKAHCHRSRCESLPAYFLIHVRFTLSLSRFYSTDFLDQVANIVISQHGCLNFYFYSLVLL